MAALNRKIALAVFGLLVAAAPLLFGAADRVVQIALVLLLGVGFLAVPPSWPRLPRGLGWLMAFFVMAVVAGEFLPAAWFGPSPWRDTLTEDFRILLPATRNPEPARAFDALLAAAIGAAFFVWVRTLAGDAPTRLALAWSLAGAAALFAIVCLALGTRTDSMIYGWRYTPGWTGYGPFPNRNHTAALLAMGALVGCGCVVRASRRKNYTLLAIGALAVALIFIALVQSKSRGGLIGFGAGLAVFGTLTVIKLRTRAALVTSLSVMLLSAALLLAFGSNLLARFDSAADGNIPQNLRWHIWRDTIAMWRTAPWFGFGLDSFAQVFPFFQTVRIDDQYVLHPESSWLLWLVELGAWPTALLAIALFFFVAKNLRGLFESERGFHIRVGALAGTVALLCHSLYDVPAHRWATAGFGLALLAIACPSAAGGARRRLGLKAALMPFAIASFWLLPLFTNQPDWSPTSLTNLLAISARTPSEVSIGELRDMTRWFPLEADLRQALGLRYLTHGVPARAWDEFRSADFLASTSWQMPATQAWIAARYSPGMSLHFWALAIERSGHRAPEIFQLACQQTAADSAKFWASYARTHPQFLTLYSEAVSDPEEARTAYELWWATRAASPELAPFEARYFYICAYKWGTREQLEIWMKKHPQLAPRDFKDWAGLMHHWQDDPAAWRIVASASKEPVFPKNPIDTGSAALEARWFADPADTVNAQALACDLARRGDADGGARVIFSVAAGKNPPAWFVEKAAWFYAARGEYGNAVKMFLRDSHG